MKHKKLLAAERTAQILGDAVKLAEREGFQRITRHSLARAAGVSEALVSHYFGTMVALRRAIMREAIRVECLGVIAQGITDRDRHALKAPRELQNRALTAHLKTLITA